MGLVLLVQLLDSWIVGLLDRWLARVLEAR